MEIDYDKEEFFLKEFIKSVKYLKRPHGVKMEHTGCLTHWLAKELGMESLELYYSGYYANVGMLALDHLINTNAFLTGAEKDLIKQHVHYSAEFVERRGLFACAEIIRKHHEKPNGAGYFGQVNRDRNSILINIADEFIGMISPNALRPALPLKVAVGSVLEPLKTARSFTPEEIKVIEKVLQEEHARLDI